MPLRLGINIGMGCLNRIFKMRLDTNFVQEETNAGYMGRHGSFQIKQHSTGFIGSADDIIFSTEPGIEANSLVISGENFWD